MKYLEELYWFFKIGKPNKKLSVFQLREELNIHIQSPVFFLSTGRCGTKWFNDLLSSDRNLRAFHNPLPNLSVAGTLAWSDIHRANYKLLMENSGLYEELFLTGREQYLRYTAKAGKRYVETNNYVTFFLPFLISLFPDAKFVHLVRNPVGFIKSGIDRSYYMDGNIDDMKRISTNKVGEYSWDKLSRYGKIAWLWQETNRFIDIYSNEIDSDKYIRFPFDLPEIDGVRAIVDFIGADISDSRIQKMLLQKKNFQKNRACPPFSEWTSSHQEQVNLICGDLAKKYGFEIG